MPASIVWSEIQMLTGITAGNPFNAFGPSSADLTIQDGDLLVFFFTGNKAFGDLGTFSFSGSEWQPVSNLSDSPIISVYRFLNNNDWNDYDGGPGVGDLPYEFTSTVNIGRLLIGAAVVRGVLRNFYGLGMQNSGGREPMNSEEAFPWRDDPTIYGDPGGPGGFPYTEIDTDPNSLDPAIYDADGGVIIGALSISINSGSTSLAFSNYVGVTELARSENSAVSMLLFGQAYAVAQAPVQITADITSSDNAGIMALGVTSAPTGGGGLVVLTERPRMGGEI